ncbi:MAG: glycerophosphodiester phosphodiesterase family protein [Alphaproteobacteria bacterium]
MSLDIIGHRGARGFLPENTLEAIRYALDQGVAGIEIDVQITKDGHVVAHHDPWVNQDTTVGPAELIGKPLHQLSLAQVKQLNIGRLAPGTAYAKRFPNQRPLAHAAVPTLPEVLALVRDKAKLYIEVKTHTDYPELPQADAVVPLILRDIKQAGMQDQCVLISFDWNALKLAAGLDTIYLVEVGVQFPRSITEPSQMVLGMTYHQIHYCPACAVKAQGGHWWGPDGTWLRDEDIRQAKQLGITTNVWTVNDVDQSQHLADLGVESVTTDYPGVFYLEE